MYMAFLLLTFWENPLHHLFPECWLAEMHVALLQNVNKGKYYPMSDQERSDIMESPFGLNI